MLNKTERELLLTCARQALSPELARRAGELFAVTHDWQEILDAANRHGIAPLLFHHAQSSGINTVPTEVLHRLRQTYVRSAFRYRVHAAAITAFAERFSKRGISFLLLKGAGVAPTLYRDPALRPFADIDLLIGESNIDAAKQALIDCGYEIAPELLSEELNRKYHFNLPFVRREPVPVHVELHWGLTDRFNFVRFDSDDLFSQSRPISGENDGASVLSDEDNFVYLAAHLDTHGYLNRVVVGRDADELRNFFLSELSGDRLIWLTDLHELATKGLNWDTVVRQAGESGATGTLRVTLELLKALLNTTFPNRLMEATSRPAVTWPRRQIGVYIVKLARDQRRKSAIQNFLRRTLLSTRTGFELRLIRLLDIWQYIFPARTLVPKNYFVHVGSALAQCGRMFFELSWRRAFRALTPRA